MRSRRCSRSCASVTSGGFSLVELLLAMTLTVGIGAAALTLTLSSRQLYDADVARTDVEQSLRVTRDFVTIDLRQAGERLNGRFPALEIVRGEDLPGGAAGDPDELIVRRNLLYTVLPVCEDPADTTGRVLIAWTDPSPPPRCVPGPDNDADGWSDNLQDWREYRIANGVPGMGGNPRIRAYLFNPVTHQGEFFDYMNDRSAGVLVTRRFHTWQHSYPMAQRPRAYLIEERRYRVVDGRMQVVVDGDDQDPIQLTDAIDDFQLLARFQDGTTRDALGPSDDWSGLRAIEVGISASVDRRGSALRRSMTMSVVPRNVLSQ